MTPEMQEYVSRLDAESTVLEAELRKARAKRALLKLDAGIWLLRFYLLVCIAIGFGFGWAARSAIM